VASHADEWRYAIGILPENERPSNVPPARGKMPRASARARVAFRWYCEWRLISVSNSVIDSHKGAHPARARRACQRE